MKKIIKAHKGFAHVPESSQGKRRQIGLPQRFRGSRRRAPNLEQIKTAFGTSKLTPKELRTIEETKKSSRNVKPTNLTLKQLKAQRDAYERQRKGLSPARDPRVDNYRDNRTPRRASAPRPQAPTLVRRTPAMQEPKVITQPKPVVRPPKIMDGEGGRGTRPVFELPNKGRGKNIRRPKPQVRSAQVYKNPMVGKPITRTMQQGGYVSRAKYGIVNNLKKGK